MKPKRDLRSMKTKQSNFSRFKDLKELSKEGNNLKDKGKKMRKYQSWITNERRQRRVDKSRKRTLT